MYDFHDSGLTVYIDLRPWGTMFKLMTKSIWIGISGQQWDQNKGNYTWNTTIPIHQNKHSKLDGKVTRNSQ